MFDFISNAQLVSGQPNDNHELALVMKLTFSISENGQCIPAEEQVPIDTEWSVYDNDIASPLVSPPKCDSDLFAFKSRTDVVVQGYAHSYGRPVTTLNVELRLPNISRVVRVYGDRNIEWRGQTPVFTPAQVFERMPIRYDRAYGGFDSIYQPEDTDKNKILSEPMKTEPEWQLETTTDRHYPRNPAGRGFLIELSRAATNNLLLPNLEFPFDPITPERLAIGKTVNWLNAPLPATFDWVDPSWFPRIAYLGLSPEYVLPETGVKEIKLGWVDSDLMALKSALQGGLHPDFQQGASPGLTLPLNPGTQMIFHNLFPFHPERRIQLSAKKPEVEIQITEQNRVPTVTHLNTVIIRPELNQVIEVWSARVKVQRPYWPTELDEMKWTVNWK